MKLLLIAGLILVSPILWQGRLATQPIQDGSWLYTLRVFREMRFPASKVPSKDPVLLGITLSVDKKGRVHDVTISPAGTPFSEAANRAVQGWRFTAEHSANLEAHICIGRQDDGEAVGLPCDVFGSEESPHLRLLLFSSSTFRIQSPLRPHLSDLAASRLRSEPTRVNWLTAKLLISEDGSVLEVYSSGEIVDQELASQMKESLRFAPIHLSGRSVEVVTDAPAEVFSPLPKRVPEPQRLPK